MGARRRRVVWALSGQQALDEAVSYVAKDSLPAARRLLDEALQSAATLDTFSERGRVVPEIGLPSFRELLVQRYRLIYEITDSEIRVLTLLHTARDYATWRRGGGIAPGAA